MVEWEVFLSRKRFIEERELFVVAAIYLVTHTLRALEKMRFRFRKIMGSGCISLLKELSSSVR